MRTLGALVLGAAIGGTVVWYAGGALRKDYRRLQREDRKRAQAEARSQREYDQLVSDLYPGVQGQADYELFKRYVHEQDKAERISSDDRF